MHESVGRARFPLEHVKKLSVSEPFWKMRSAKCARDFSESSVSHKKGKKEGFGPLLAIHPFQLSHVNSLVSIH